MAEIYVGLSVPKNKFKIGSFVIRWAEYPGWFGLFFASHVFTLFPPNDKRKFFMVHEAAGAMVRFVSQDHFKDHADILNLYQIHFDADDSNFIELLCELSCGTPYAFMENVGIAMVRTVRILTGKRIANPFGEGTKSQKCSELVVRNVLVNHLVNIGMDLPQLAAIVTKRTNRYCPEDVDLIGVEDIYEMLEALVEMGNIRRVDMCSERVTK